MENQSELTSLLTAGAREFGVEMDTVTTEKFFIYQKLLKEWNEKMNLTAIEEDRDIIQKHFVDSLSIMPYIKKHLSSISRSSSSQSEVHLIDVGTGAGFPGLPVKMIAENMGVTLLDSLDKRVKFLKEVIDQLKLNNIEAVHGRAEDFGMMQEHREKYDIAVARAVAGLPVLLEYCLPFVKPGGIFIAMKGSHIEEVEASGKALDLLGGKLVEVSEITLPFSEMKRNILVVKKFRQTPTKYPRKAGKPSKEPLV